MPYVISHLPYVESCVPANQQHQRMFKGPINQTGKTVMGLGDFFKKMGLKATDEHKGTAHLAQMVAPLDVVRPGLAGQVLSYLESGEQANVLLALEQFTTQDCAVALGKPGTLTWWHPRNLSSDIADEKHKALLKQGIDARAQLYAAVGTPEVSPVQLIRLGKLLSAACNNENLIRTTDLVPAWFLYLLADGLQTSLPKTGQANDLSTRTGWTIDLLQSLLVLEDIPAERILPAVFDRKDLNSYYHDHFANILKLSDLKRYLLDHPLQVDALPPQLSSEGNILLARTLGSHEDLKDHYTPLLVRLAVHSAKGVRTEAEQQLGSITDQQSGKKMAALVDLFKAGSNPERVRAAELLARSGPDARPLLVSALAEETAKTVQQALQQAIFRIDASGEAAADALPAMPAITPFPDATLAPQALTILRSNLAEVLDHARESAAAEVQHNKDSTYKRDWSQRQYKALQKLSDRDLEHALTVINGQINERFKDNLQQVLGYKNRLKALPGFHLMHAIRTIVGLRHAEQRQLHWNQILYWLNDDDLRQLDLRLFVDALQRAGLPDAARQVATLCLSYSWSKDLLDYLEADQIWPFFADHLAFLQEALGLTPSLSERYQDFQTRRGLRVLESFPALPSIMVAGLLELALGDGKTYRLDAQGLLAKLPDIRLQAEAALESSKQERRITAAEWLVSIHSPESLPALTAALKKEKRETVRAALLSGIETLGGDISAYLSPAILLKEAEKGLSAKPPASLAWFNYTSLPAATWAKDSQTVDPRIIQWWVILACKLKEPAGNALINRYLSLLDRDSQAQLGGYVLQHFIAQDTRHPTEAEADAIATADAPARLAMYLNWYKQYPDYYGMYQHYTLAQAHADIKRERLAVYLGSAIADKGLLALIWPTTGHALVRTLQQYTKDHYTRRSQIEAMLMAAANSNDPVIIQLLLSISRRYRTASVQEKARELVQAIADRNGWSRDELADRTIPTAGFDESGILTLYYGERIFSARMDGSFRIILLNPEGKEVKALPEPRKTDDAELIKEAKNQLSSSKKELKQVVDLQTLRLYESMCAGRQWPVAEWREYLYAHPVMNRLLQQLVWEEVRDGQPLQTFRPTEDGSLINTKDDEIELACDSMIQLAHAAILPAEQAQAWLAHFTDYKIKPLFAQMTHPRPDRATVESKSVTETDAHEAQLRKTHIETRKGWLTDTFTFRGVMTKLGYQRAQAEDGGYFSHYFKEFASLGICVNIDFSGNTLPEENVPAILYGLYFESMQGKSWNRRTLPIDEVPAILLAEAYADYLSVAEACIGFDPDWKKKSPW